jgi:hypothetical protein
MLNHLHSDERTSVCHGSPKGNVYYRGADYSFEDKKTSEMTNSLDQEDTNSNDQDCIVPDPVQLIDERNYTVTNVEDTIVQDMVSLQATHLS